MTDAVQLYAESLFRAHRDRGEAGRISEMHRSVVRRERPVVICSWLEEACVDAVWETLDDRAKEALLADAESLLDITNSTKAYFARTRASL